MNDFVDNTIAKLRLHTESPALNDPEAFADEVMDRIRNKHFRVMPLVRRIAYAAAISALLIFAGANPENGKQRESYSEPQRVTPAETMANISNSIKLAEHYVMMKK